MKRRWGLWFLLGLTAASLAACGQPAAVPAADLEVESQREVELAEGRIVSLSPDGKWLLVEKQPLLCIHDVESLAQHSCTETPVGIDLQHAAWSPDSTRVAFTENVFRHFRDSDVWVWQALDGTLNNLTDDGFEDDILGIPAGATVWVDAIPAWSPDGKTLVFARTTLTDRGWGATVLCRISAEGGKTEDLVTVSDSPVVVWGGMRWLEDGRSIVLTMAGSQLDSPENGLWIVGRDGSDLRRIFTPDPKLSGIVLLGVSARKNTALIQYQAAMYGGPEPGVPFVFLVDLETGEAVPLMPPEGPGVEFISSPPNATFSPDGSKVLYTTNVQADPDGAWLVVRDVAGGEDHVLLKYDAPLGISQDQGRGLNWAANNRIHLSVNPFGVRGLLVELGEK